MTINNISDLIITPFITNWKLGGDARYIGDLNLTVVGQFNSTAIEIQA